MSETTFENKCSILGDLYISYRDDEDFADFMQYNDLGLPLAFAVDSELVSPTPQGEEMISETFQLLLEALSLGDNGWETLGSMMEADKYEIPIHYINESEEEEEVELSDGGEYRQGYETGFLAGAKAEQERVQAIAEMNMKWAKQSNKGNEFMQWHNVSEILKPVTIDHTFDDEDF